MTASSVLPLATGRHLWLQAQRLLDDAPFGSGPDAVRRAVEHLGYVQIDTINVIERSHHHILYSRIPDYRTADLAHAQSVEKSVFEYWAHALAYIPTVDYRYFVPAMDAYRAKPRDAFDAVPDADYAALLRRIGKEGGLSIRDIDDDVLVDKIHPWASRKPSKRALNFGFYNGDLAISQRAGMLKTYALATRHFGWRRRPAGATDQQFAQYLLARALRSQGIVSIDSICYGNIKAKPLVRALVATGVRRKRLQAVHLAGLPAQAHWVAPDALDAIAGHDVPPVVHILSPFDPLIIQRKRLASFFGYDHRFEAYVPADKRVHGYFALPVLMGDEVVAALDLKMDRVAGRLRVQKWTWVARRRAGLKASIDEAMHRFERFQQGP
jgi:uncharacterized protein YcaQ